MPPAAGVRKANSCMQVAAAAPALGTYHMHATVRASAVQFSQPSLWPVNPFPSPAVLYMGITLCGLVSLLIMAVVRPCASPPCARLMPGTCKPATLCKPLQPCQDCLALLSRCSWTATSVRVIATQPVSAEAGAPHGACCAGLPLPLALGTIPGAGCWRRQQQQQPWGRPRLCRCVPLRRCWGMNHYLLHLAALLQHIALSALSLLAPASRLPCCPPKAGSGRQRSVPRPLVVIQPDRSVAFGVADDAGKAAAGAEAGGCGSEKQDCSAAALEVGTPAADQANAVSHGAR